MGYDDVILQMGDFGRYQRRIFFILCLPLISCGIHKFGGFFLAAKADFRCLLPHENSENATYELPPIVANLSYPWDYNTGSWSRCERYDRDLADHDHDVDGNFSSASITVKCDSFIYDKSQYVLTATTEWNLVCDNTWLQATSNAIFPVGEMFGSIIFGALSDRYGRKTIFVLVLALQLLSGILLAFSPELISYMIFRFIVGLTASGVFLIAYVMAFEMVGPTKRLLAGTICQFFLVTGSISIAGLAYFITNWRVLQIAFTVPSFTFVAYWWFVSESARWLLAKGRVQEAKDMLQKAALENCVELSQDVLDRLSNNDSKTNSSLEQPSALDLMRYPNLRRKSLILFFVWFVNSGTYYGLSWNTSNFGGQDYVNYGITAAVEIPAHLFIYFTLDKCGRRIITTGCMLFAGTCLLLTLSVPADMPSLIVVFAVLGKLSITSAYAAVYVFTTEQFPTGIRNVGLGVCSTSARFGAILAPYISQLAEVWMHLPLVVLGSCSFIAGLLTLLLPETMDTRLPESIQDGEELGKRVSKNDQDMRVLDHCNVVQSTTSPEIVSQI